MKQATTLVYIATHLVMSISHCVRAYMRQRALWVRSMVSSHINTSKTMQYCQGFFLVSDVSSIDSFYPPLHSDYIYTAVGNVKTKLLQTMEQIATR